MPQNPNQPTSQSTAVSLLSGSLPRYSVMSCYVILLCHSLVLVKYSTRSQAVARIANRTATQQILVISSCY